MKRSYGFTVIEVIVVVVFLGLATTLLLMQKTDLAAAQRDNQRKTAINAMYYNLEEVYYAKNGYYPPKIDSTILTAMDPNLFTDPDSTVINDSGAEYHYNASNCQNNQCKSYKLSADMEKEATYTKSSRHS
jgi:type II secretory pathway pseudopilin PulG